MELGEFAGNDDGAVGSERLLNVIESFEDAVWGFETDGGVVGAGEGFEQRLTFARLWRKKAEEVEGVGGESGRGECGERRGGSGDGDDGDARLDGGGDESITGVGDEGSAGVGYNCYRFAGGEAAEEFRSAFALVVVVIADKWSANVVVLEEFRGLPSVFASDSGSLTKDAEGTESNVFEVADGGGYDEELGRHTKPVWHWGGFGPRI